MNILFLCDEYPPGKHGGIGSVVQLLARTLVSQGHNIVVAGFYDWGYAGEDYFDDLGVKIYRFRRGLSSSFFSNQNSLITRGFYRLFKDTGIWEWDIKKSLKRYTVFLEEIIRKHQIDIVEMPDYNDYFRFCNTVVPFPKLSVPVIVKLHGSLSYYANEYKRPLPATLFEMEKQVVHNADYVVGVSDYVGKKSKACFHYNKSIKALFNGIETNILPTGHIEKNKGQVMFTGALSDIKGVYQLMKAWNKVIIQTPDAILLVYGRGPVEKVQALLNSDALPTVSFLGHVNREDLFMQLAKSQVAVFPSYAESFGLAPVEAMACGTATIFTKFTSGPEIIDDGINGLLIDPDNVDELAESILLLLNNEEKAAEFAIKGKEKALQQFGLPVIAQRHVEYYKKCIGK